jgi:D-arabinose 1-dehydrogenase-like Zn-dependent alcohol dehydrogenase
MEPLSVAVWACQKVGVRPGVSVLVTGAGPIGLLTVQAARAARRPGRAARRPRRPGRRQGDGHAERVRV